jgi:hypothetical protein
VIAEAIVELDTRPPVVHVTAITGLRINQELLAAIGRRVNSGAALRDGCVEFVAQTKVQYDPRRRFPGVLGINSRALRLSAAGPMFCPLEKYEGATARV